MPNLFNVAETMTADFALDLAIMGEDATYYHGSVGTSCVAMRSYLSAPETDEQGNPLVPAMLDFVLSSTVGSFSVGDNLVVGGRRYMVAASAGGQCVEPVTPETGALVRIHTVDAGAWSANNG